MKLIKISTDMKLTIHDFPEGSYLEQNKVLRSLIGRNCELYEHVMPKRLYKELGGISKIDEEPGNCVSMLIDEEGLLKKLPFNVVGSWLYETDVHGCPIVGNILIVGERWAEDGIDFCGIAEEQFKHLYPKLKELTDLTGVES